MSQGIHYLHSHSGLERSLAETASDKFHVLVDEKFKEFFTSQGVDVKQFVHDNKKYYKVPTYIFFRMGGVFKNLSK